MVYDDVHCAEVAPRPYGAILHETSRLANLAFRSLSGLILLSVAGLILTALLGGGFRPFDAPGWKALVGWLVIGVLSVIFIVLPLYAAAEILGHRWEYVFDRAQRQLVARSWWFGVVPRPRRYGFDEFQRVCVRCELHRSHFGSRWLFYVSCEGQATSVRLVCCEKRQRARELAEAVAAQVGLPTHDVCDA